MQNSKKITPERKKEIIEMAKKTIGNIWSHPKGSRGGKEFIDNQCEYCGKKVGSGSNTRFVHILTSGAILPNGVCESEIMEFQNEIGNQSQGCFAIGSECAKKLLGKEIDNYSFKF